MNAPLPSSSLAALATASLEDKYTQQRGRVYMSGIQALVRLPMLQHDRDALQGLHTAGFISGYRGSPLGGYDQALWAAQTHLAEHDIVFQPGVNEELAATAVWGSQQLALRPEQQRFDGVFGLWYGKGPGLDRSADAFKHANMAGTAKHGGVLAVAGDDHVAKSSSLAHQSDHIFKACGLPVFFPSNVQEILDLGLHAWALSRYAGLWSGFKTIQEVVESSSTVSVDPERVQIVLPDDFGMPEGGLHIRWPDAPLAQEARLMDHKWYAALAYIRANQLNHTVLDSHRAQLGLIASGKAYNDLRQALHDLGLDDDACRRIGLRVHKVAVVWPLEASSTREFAKGLREILVIEEKRQMIEYQLKEELYNWREDVRPNVLGKFNEGDGDVSGGEWSHPRPASRWLLPAKADLNPALIAKAVVQRIDKLGLLQEVEPALRDRILERLRVIEAKETALSRAPSQVQRPPWFCSGCPHNTSTHVPEGSRALAGIGCHYMAMWMDRDTETFSQMGGEGVSWVGQAPFTTEPHVFANLGDGTYYHSGLLAIRQAIAAKVNITYKILYNHAVAMTGGQPLEGHLTVGDMAAELLAEGCAQVVVVSDEPKQHVVDGGLPPDVQLFHRDQLDGVQKMLRDVPGCTALIYDQGCAAEKRRHRKRGTEPEIARRVVIHEEVCEGCGDCAVQSNCLSVETVETELGRKRRINQSSCNQDFSCLKGFCPSLVTIEGGSLRKATSLPGTPSLASLPPLPEAKPPRCVHAYGILAAGIGGSGIITLGQLLGMAAHMEGKAVVTQDAAGLAQKGGATWSHVQIAEQQRAIHTTKVGMAEADLVFGGDAIVAAHETTLSVMQKGRTRLVLNSHGSPTGAGLQDTSWTFPARQCDEALNAALSSADIRRLDATAMAERLLGDAIYASTFMLGYAWQMGWIPLERASLERAIELNRTAVTLNLQAFAWGRHAAHDGPQWRQVSMPSAPLQWRGRGEAMQRSLDDLVRARHAALVSYQDEAYAQRYLDLMARVRKAERPLGSERLTFAVARYLYKLMAVKDEYEVARLLTSPEFERQLESQFEGDWRIVYHLAPPSLRGINAEATRPRKLDFGPRWRIVLRGIAWARRWRGTWMDPLRSTAEHVEAKLVLRTYVGALTQLLPKLNAQNHALACQIAELPERIKGYGLIRQPHTQAALLQWEQWLAQGFAAQ